MSTIKIFISHSSKDIKFAEKIKSYLEKKNFEIWLDVERLRIGDNLPKEIREGIRKCDFFLVLISQNSLQSKWVEKEITLASYNEFKGRKNHIIIGKLDHSSLSSNLYKKPYLNFKNIQDFEKELEKFISKINVNKVNELCRCEEEISKLKKAHVYSLATIRFKTLQGIKLVYINEGTYYMGSQNHYSNQDESPIHSVKIMMPFWISVFPITRSKWFEVQKGVRTTTENEMLPISNVSWYEIFNFLDKLNLNSPNGFGWDLPTEEEWEYCARAGTKDDFFFGNNDIFLDRYSWYNKNSSLMLHPVGELLHNPWGLHDILGNVYEWCKSDYILYNRKNNDYWEFGAKLKSKKILRGGSFLSDKTLCRVATRKSDSPTTKRHDYGFRIVLRKK